MGYVSERTPKFVSLVLKCELDLFEDEVSVYKTLANSKEVKLEDVVRFMGIYNDKRSGIYKLKEEKEKEAVDKMNEQIETMGDIQIEIGEEKKEEKVFRFKKPIVR